MMNKILEGEIQKGRTTIVAIIVIIIFTTLNTSLIVAASYNLLFEPTILLIHIIRFLLTIFLLWLLYKGYDWARWVNIVLFRLVGAYSIFFGLELLTKSFIVTDFFGLLMLIISVAYLGSAGFLLFSSNVTTFLNHQKSKMDK